MLASVGSLQAGPFFAAGEDPKPAGKYWQAVDNMSDDFDDGVVDTGKWQLEPVGNGWNWIGRPPGLFRPENVSESDGKLKVTVSELVPAQVIDGKTFTYQGAIVRSLNPGQVGWYFEAKMKANATEMSSTFWLMTKYNCEQKLETDIQECIGRTTELTASWAVNWDHIFHSNVIHRQTSCNPTPTRDQDSVPTPTANHERFYVYGCWWKSTGELEFYLDGEYTYTLIPTTTWDVEAFIQMAIETYDWNPVPSDGGMVKAGTLEQRTTQYEWVRVWQLTDGLGVDAGPDQTIVLPDSDAVLTATVSDPGSVSHVSWDQVSGPNTATLSGASTMTLQASGLIAGTYVFEFTATDTGGSPFSDQVTVTVSANLIPEIKSFSLPYGEIGSPYQFTISTESGNPPFTWSIVEGSLPAGLTMNDGVISGTPTAAERKNLIVRVTDMNGDADEQALALHVVAQLPTGTVTFSPTDDAYLQGTTRYNDTFLKIEDGWREGYLKFNISGIGEQVKSGILSLRANGDSGNGTIRFFEGSHNNWTETTLTDAAKPAPVSEVGSMSGSFSSGNTYTVELAPLLNGKGDGTYTVIVKMDNGGNDVWFSSTEGAVSPSLEVTYFEPVDNYATWAQIHFSDLPGGAANPQAAFDAVLTPGNLPNGVFYTYDASPAGDSNLVALMLPSIGNNQVSFRLPVNLPPDITVRLESTTSMSSGSDWPTTYTRNPDGTWPAPVGMTDNGDGTVSLTLPLGSDPAAFYRLRFLPG